MPPGRKPSESLPRSRHRKCLDLSAMKPMHAIHTVSAGDIPVTVTVDDYDMIEYGDGNCALIQKVLSLYETPNVYLVTYEWNGDCHSIAFFSLPQQWACIATPYYDPRQVLVVRETFSSLLACSVGKLLDVMPPWQALNAIVDKSPANYRVGTTTLRAMKKG